MAEANKSAMSQKLPFFLISGYLILTCAKRVLITANEYPMRTSQVLDMVIDGAALICLVGLWVGLSKMIKVSDKSAAPMTALFLVALVAGIALFGIRLTSDAAWWTGHLNYALD
jgi:protein-S-isoprenylcysteine O-methyltransferase Ste14